MRIYVGLCLVLITPSLVFADGRICTKKSDGSLVEYQSGKARLGTLIENAVSAGYNKDEVEEKYITDKEWEVYREEKINKPEKEARKKKEAELKIKKEAIRIKLNLTEEEFDTLNELFH